MVTKTLNDCQKSFKVFSYINYYENIPNYWAKSTLKTVCTKIIDGSHNPPKGENNKTNYIMLSSQNIGDGKLLNLDKVRFLKESDFNIENKRTCLLENDLLFTSVGSIGRSYVYKDNLNIVFQRSVSIITTLINPRFLKLFLDAPKTQNYIIKNSSGTAQKGFYLNQLSSMVIYFPSISEQEKIIEKLELIIRSID